MLDFSQQLRFHVEGRMCRRNKLEMAMQMNTSSVLSVLVISTRVNKKQDASSGHEREAELQTLQCSLSRRRAVMRLSFFYEVK